MVSFDLNGKQVSARSEDSTPLLWVIRDELKLTGTKFGCGQALCGACTVHVNGKAVRSCTTPLSSVKGARVTTIEGLSPDSSHALQKAWIADEVPQCGYCQSPKPTREQIVKHMDGNICRCGTYHRIVAAIQRASKEA
jgi:isoquinoline 1-oxidoreductase alpha subunit